MVLIGVAHVVVSVVIIFTLVGIFGYAVPVMIPAGRIAISSQRFGDGEWFN